MSPQFSSDEARAHLAAIVESSGDAIISKTLDGVVLSWNGGAERLYGYPAREAIGRVITFLLPEGREDEEDAILERIRRGERIEHFETVRRRKGGATVDVSLTISPVLDDSGRIVAASHIARDITEQKRDAEQAARLAAIVDSSDDAIVGKTVEGIILTWNAGAERVYGYKAEEAMGKPMTIVLPPDRPNEETEILERIGRGERVDHFETIRKTKQGRLIDVSITISPIYDKLGRIVGASHVARDVTERKQMEEQINHTQKLESLGVLAGGVAHDFNNLLTGILGNASLAIESLSTHSPVRPLIEDVVDASERAAHLTRQLLAYAGKGRFVIEPVNLSELVREISHLVQTSIAKNVQLRLDLRDDLPMVLADASQLQQIVMNLVINGAEAVGAKENGTVLVTTSAQQVDEHYLATVFSEIPDLKPGTFVVLEVHDTGCGMDEETLARIFEPFFTTKFTGRGLGLAAVQGIVRGHNGALKVYSRPGHGTSFKVLFPATGGEAERKAPLVAARSGKNELILVIDDEELIRRTAKSMLERHGYSVAVAMNGKEGVRIFQGLADNVAVVLLDMTMPVMSGEEAFGHLKAIKPSAKIILSSGYNEAEAVRRFSGKGLSGFIQKPYSSSELMEKLKLVLDE